MNKNINKRWISLS